MVVTQNGLWRGVKGIEPRWHDTTINYFSSRRVGRTQMMLEWRELYNVGYDS